MTPVILALTCVGAYTSVHMQRKAMRDRQGLLSEPSVVAR